MARKLQKYFETLPPYVLKKQMRDLEKKKKLQEQNAEEIANVLEDSVEPLTDSIEPIGSPIEMVLPIENSLPQPKISEQT